MRHSVKRAFVANVSKKQRLSNYKIDSVPGFAFRARSKWRHFPQLQANTGFVVLLFHMVNHLFRGSAFTNKNLMYRRLCALRSSPA